uniref:TPR_REGION domain-containing protein n=1 Tax=Anopheles stephensi TaxID=30069 RepID=A0A182YIZ0_ANOST
MFSLKSNRTSDAIRMLERCIQLEPLFTAAYLELAKLYGGQPAAAGRLLARVVRLNPYNADLRRQYGDWLLEQNMLLEAFKQYQEGIKIMETHQLSVIGACRCLRKMGQQSRLHQMVLRWQFIVRLSNGGIPIQNDIYLRDWSIKHELRNRAMIYDSGSSSSSSSSSSGSSSSNSDSSTSSSIANGDRSTSHPSKQTDPHPHQPEPAEISIRILRTPHCNRSEHLPNSLKACKLVTATSSPQPEPTTSTTNPSTSTGKGGGKSKKWSKTRHKPKRQPPAGTTLDPNGALAPLLVSNLLDKL